MAVLITAAMVLFAATAVGILVAVQVREVRRFRNGGAR